MKTEKEIIRGLHNLSLDILKNAKYSDDNLYCEVSAEDIKAIEYLSWTLVDSEEK